MPLIFLLTFLKEVKGLFYYSFNMLSCCNVKKISIGMRHSCITFLLHDFLIQRINSSAFRIRRALFIE